MNIVVYLGASLGNNSFYKEEAIKLGKYIADSNNTLVFGGSGTGLMGELVESVTNNNGISIGVQTKKFNDLGYTYNKLTKLIITDNMSLRKLKMIELGDVFIAFPGGTGTLEEISEVITKSVLKEINNKVIIYNLNHYYDDLINLFNKMKENEFTNNDKLSNIYFPTNLDELKILLL